MYWCDLEESKRKENCLTLLSLPGFDLFRFTFTLYREAASQLDLEEALEASRYASHPYSTHPQEWPPLIEVGETWELPSVLIERYNTAGGEGTALCGIFPEIRRAWASVDNSLFLWRFDKRDGQCPEYSGDEQAICAIGLAKCRPGVFVEAIQYLLVLTTPVELVLVGVCCTEGPDGRDPYAEISVQPLPDYTISSDGVTMTCITCTNKGRIFMAGRDGHIYELLYTTGSSWHKRCRKVCLTAGVGSMISRWVVPNVFKFGAVDPVVEMVVDNERQILYARTEEMKLQAYIFGPNGELLKLRLTAMNSWNYRNRVSFCIYIRSIAFFSEGRNRNRHFKPFFCQILSHSTMGDSQDVKTKGPYTHWSEPESKMLLRLLVRAIDDGFRDANGKFNKLTVETRILPALNQKFGNSKTYSQYRNMMKILKGKYQSLADLLRFSSGFGWDPQAMKFTARDEVWDDYLKAHPNNTHLRNESFEDFEDLRMIFGSHVATGQNAVGLGDGIDADTFQAGNNERINDINHVQIMDDRENISYEERSVHEVFSSLEKRRAEKLPQRKKARTDTIDEVNGLTEMSHQLFGMIQKRWEKEAEEKEAEDKANNVWDAIKEIPDLDEDLRYEAMTLVHSLGMKSGFMHMSITERNGWIKRNICKPSA